MQFGRFGVSVLLALIFAALNTGVTLAEPKKNMDKPPPGMPAENLLRQKVDLPNLPDYPGSSRFVTGSTTTSPYGQGFSEVFNSRDTPERIIEWYKGTLRQGGWKTNSENPMGIYCGKDGSSCEVTVQKLYTKEGGSRIRIGYFLKTSK
jgi:hypothetical protein